MADAGPPERDGDHPTTEDAQSSTGVDHSTTEDDSRFTFRLPPFRLPSFFPADFELVFPVPGRIRRRPVGARWAVVFAVVVDVLDAVLATTLAGPALVARSFAVFAIAVAMARVAGLVAVWELVAALMGAASITAFPSVTALLLVRARFVDDRS